MFEAVELLILTVRWFVLGRLIVVHGHGGILGGIRQRLVPDPAKLILQPDLAALNDARDSEPREALDFVGDEERWNLDLGRCERGAKDASALVVVEPWVQVGMASEGITADRGCDGIADEVEVMLIRNAGLEGDCLAVARKARKLDPLPQWQFVLLLAPHGLATTISRAGRRALLLGGSFGFQACDQGVVERSGIDEGVDVGDRFTQVAG